MNSPIFTNFLALFLFFLQFFTPGSGSRMEKECGSGFGSTAPTYYVCLVQAVSRFCSRSSHSWTTQEISSLLFFLFIYLQYSESLSFSYSFFPSLSPSPLAPPPCPSSPNKYIAKLRLVFIATVMGDSTSPATLRKGGRHQHSWWKNCQSLLTFNMGRKLLQIY